MSNRITQQQLESLADHLNNLLDRPRQPHGPDGANVGNFHISYANGGACLHTMSNKGGAVSDTLGCGHIPKRELYNRMDALARGVTVGLLTGLEKGKEEGKEEAKQEAAA